MSDKRDWILKDYENASSETLLKGIDWQNELIRELKKRIAEAEEWTSKYQGILDSRNLDAFWEANPTLLRLEVGDKLLVTQEHTEWYDRVVRNNRRTETGDIVSVGGIRVEEGIPSSVGFESMGGSIPFDLAMRMRRAYLAQQGETT